MHGERGPAKVYFMTQELAREIGRRVKRHARGLVDMGDAGTIVLNVEWQVGNQSARLGIVDAAGVVDITGEIARAFREGFTGRTLTGVRA